MELLVGGDKGVLDGVFGVVPGVEDGAGDNQGGWLVAFNQARKGLAVSRAGAFDQLLV